MDAEREPDQSQLLRQQVILAQFGELALRSDSLDEILTEACRLVGEALGTDFAKVVELQEDGRTLLVRAGVGWKDGVVGVATINAEGDTSEAYALKTGEPMISPDIAKETRFRYAPFLIDNGAQAVANVIIIGGKDRPPFGILQVDSRTPREFTDSDITFLRGYANLLAATVDRLRVLDEMRESAAQVRVALEAEVSERTRSLAESNAQLNAFAYTVSHDLRAPLRAMEGFARILLDDHGPALGSEGERYATRIVGAAKRMEGLIDDLLAFSRIRRADVALQAVDPNRAVKRAVADLLASGLNESVVQVDVDEPLPWVRADRTILGQVIGNLVSNAAKFRSKDAAAHIIVWAETRTDRVRIWIEDNGIGIAPEHQSRIFNVFERLHGQETYPGTGVGLAIVKAGIERMGGTCGVESVFGEGSRFWIELAATEAGAMEVRN